MQLGCHVSVGPLRSSENIRSFIVSSLVYCIDHKALAKRLWKWEGGHVAVITWGSGRLSICPALGPSRRKKLEKSKFVAETWHSMRKIHTIALAVKTRGWAKIICQICSPRSRWYTEEARIGWCCHVLVWQGDLGESKRKCEIRVQGGNAKAREGAVVAHPSQPCWRIYPMQNRRKTRSCP